MATYKVLQDIEAEDKLVGPLTLRQFIYACITAICLYLCFIALTKHVLFLIPIFLLPGMLTGFFAYPFGRDQPTEIWALAKIRFLFKSRRRIWDQSGVKELVTVTAPKKIEINYTNGLSQIEVKSRLRALADTIDTRGWAIKNAADGQYALPQFGTGRESSDRLFDLESFPQEVPAMDLRAADDMLDDQNTTAMTFDTMMRESNQTRRQHIMRSMNQAQNGSRSQATPDPLAPQLPQPQTTGNGSGSATLPTNDYWFMNQPAATPAVHTQVVTPGTTTSATTAEPTADEIALAERLRQQNNSQGISYAHLHTVLPLDEQQALAHQATQTTQPPVTRQPDPAIIALARNNDLNVATIARQANKQTQPPDEVVISLH